MSEVGLVHPIARQGLADSMWENYPETSHTEPSPLPTHGRVLSSAFSAEWLPERPHQRIQSCSQVPAHARLQH